MLRATLTTFLFTAVALAAGPASEPTSYPDADGFRQRSDLVLSALATQELSQWRRGYFAGGDPGKYLPGAAMAKWLKDPADPEPAKYLNDDRSFKEQYHFACVNWSRMLPLFEKSVVTDDTRRKLRDEAKRYTAYLNLNGTENHRTMWMTSANVLPYVLDTGLANQSKDATLAQAKTMLRDYVKGLYAAGQGEWDSSTYLMFDINGMLNIYDYSPDPECRLMAGAALDWFVAGYALKYRSGLYCGPNQRGHYTLPFTSIADRTGYVWFGDAAKPPEKLTDSLYTVHAITSKWRPNRVLYNLATKRLPQLPAEFRNTKPNYWYGQEIPPKVNDYAESFYVAKEYSMGSLWNGFGGQITRFQIVADTPRGAVSFTGGHPRRSDHTGKKIEEFGYADGLGRYEQSAQAGGTYIDLIAAPDDETIDYGFFKPPTGVRPQKIGDWQVFRAGDVFLGVRGIASDATVAQTDLTAKQADENQKLTTAGKPAKHVSVEILKFPGRRVGFVVETADTGAYVDEKAFATALAKTKFSAGDLSCDYTNLAGRLIQCVYRPGAATAAVTVDGKPVDPAGWKDIYNGPYIKASPGTMSVNDGVDGYVVDFTGNLPVYRDWQPTKQ